MKVLVVGNGGREHALCWKLSQSDSVTEIYCAPGNAGTAKVAQNIPIGVDEIEKLADFAIEKEVDFTVPGPEVPLCLGIVDFFRDKGLAVFGPSKGAAILEGSKCFAKNFMKRHNIPTAFAETFDSLSTALSYLENVMNNKGTKVVIKADGLAAGKGVLIVDTLEDAKNAVKECFDGVFGKAGFRILIEEYLDGEEASVLAFTDGKTIIPLLPSQDHKRVGEGDTGLNTGGMGAYCPAPVVTESIQNEINEKVLSRFLTGIEKDDLYYRGIIYAGIMITEDGPKVLEFNVRFGDPEVQAVLAMLHSDLFDIMYNVVKGTLSEADIRWHEGYAVCVVMASGGYPGDYEKGHIIEGIDEAESEDDVVVFYAGVEGDCDGTLLTSGGRVLGVTGRANELEDALSRVYGGVKKIHWKDSFYRQDIAYRALRK